MQRKIALALLGALLASAALARQSDKPDLKLTAAIDTTAAEGQPILVVHMINQSGHALRMPDPPLLCKEAPGAISVEVKFAAENSNQQQPAADCGLEMDPSGLPDIRERARNWITLRSGQDYEARRPLAMGLDTNARGTYELRAVYDGPAATPEDKDKLRSANIASPDGRFESDKVVYKINAPK